MRISTAQFYQTGVNAITGQQSKLLDVYQQISSGKRMVSPKDDPLGAAQTINTSQAQTLNARLGENRIAARQGLTLTETKLSSASDLMHELQTKIVQAQNETLNDSDRQTMSQVVTNLKETLMGIANATDGAGQYLFSGFQGDRAPFVLDAAGNAVWQADQGKRMIQVDNARQMSSSDDGKQVFSTAADGDRSYFTGSPATNTGSATISSAVITNPTGANIGNDFKIDFSGAPLDTTVTVYDKTGAVVGAPVTAPYDTVTGKVTLPGGLDVTVSTGAVPGDSFYVKTVKGEDINVFQTLDKLAAALKAPVTGNTTTLASLRNTLNESQTKLSANFGSFLTVRSSIGVRINELDVLDSAGSTKDLGYKGELARLEDVDMYTATMELQMRKTNLDAATQAFQIIQQLSFFNAKA